MRQRFPLVVVAALVGAAVWTGCAKKLKAPEVSAPQPTPVAYEAETATPVPPPPPAATDPCDEAKALVEQAKTDIAAAVDVTPELIEAQSLLDLAKSSNATAETNVAGAKCPEAVEPAKIASVKAKEAQALALKMKADRAAADCQAAEARLRAAETAFQEAKDAGADKWEKDLMIQAFMALAKAKKLFEEKNCAGVPEPAVEAETKARAALAAKPVEKPALAAEKPKDEFRYRVRKGDCLWDIASTKKIYSDPWVWPLMYQSNRDQITDPNLIFPGQLLLVPRDSSAEQVKEAVSAAQAAPWPRRKSK